jgi:hypothetical protein
MDVSLDHAEKPVQRAFAQPTDQALPREFLAMLVEIDRARREVTSAQQR